MLGVLLLSAHSRWTKWVEVKTVKKHAGQLHWVLIGAWTTLQAAQPVGVQCYIQALPLADFLFVSTFLSQETTCFSLNMYVLSCVYILCLPCEYSCCHQNVPHLVIWVFGLISEQFLLLCSLVLSLVCFISEVFALNPYFVASFLQLLYFLFILLVKKRWILRLVALCNRHKC
jgi:hypothetical protein